MLSFQEISVLFLAALTCAHSFVPSVERTGATCYRPRSVVRLGAGASTAATKTTLTDETTWKLRFVMQGIATEKGKKVDEIFSITANFIEDEGYEPPQGTVQQIPNENDRLKIVKSYWKLSEDPNDRKDGLWVWGLFKEPLYPFLLLQLETEAIPISGECDDTIKPLQLYAQINHKRDEDAGVILEGSELNVREKETIKADPFGAARVDIFDEVNIGTISIQPMV